MLAKRWRSVPVVIKCKQVLTAPPADSTETTGTGKQQMWFGGGSQLDAARYYCPQTTLCSGGVSLPVFNFEVGCLFLWECGETFFSSWVALLFQDTAVTVAPTQYEDINSQQVHTVYQHISKHSRIEQENVLLRFKWGLKIKIKK